MFSKVSPAVLSIIIFNMIPIWGVIYEDWSPFEMFWLFWVETLVISFFNSIRVLFSQGIDRKRIHEPVKLHLNFINSIKYLVIRFLVFVFYAIFIIVFIGLLAHEQDPVHLVKVMAMQNLLFNLAIFQCIGMNAYFIATRFFMNNDYLHSRTTDYPSIFDGRQIVIHVAIVLGAVGSSFLFDNSNNPHYSSIWIISTFCLAKCIYELLLLKRTNSIEPSLLKSL